MSGEVIIKWSSKEMMFKINDSETVGCLKRKIEEETRVQPKRQKLLGLKAKGGKLATDDMMLTDLALKPGQKIMLIGYVPIPHHLLWWVTTKELYMGHFFGMDFCNKL